MGKHVVAKKEVSLLAFGGKLARCIAVKKPDKRRNPLLNRDCGDVGGRLDAKDRDFLFDKVLKKIAVVAGDFHHKTLLVDREALNHQLGVGFGVREPTVGIGSEIEVVTENVFGGDKLLKLYQETLPANIDVKRVERLHLTQLLMAQEALRQRRSAQVHKGVFECGSAKAAT